VKCRNGKKGCRFNGKVRVPIGGEERKTVVKGKGVEKAAEIVGVPKAGPSKGKGKQVEVVIQRPIPGPSTGKSLFLLQVIEIAN
jgi:hypothetical protein